MTGWQGVAEISFWVLMLCALIFVTRAGWRVMLLEFSQSDADSAAGKAGQGSATLASSPTTRAPSLAGGGVPACRVCGCTDYAACDDPELGVCWWVSSDLCSVCDREVSELLTVPVVRVRSEP